MSLRPGRPIDLRILRVYHAGRSEAQRARDRALVALGANVTLVVPAAWPGPEDAKRVAESRVGLVELEAVRAGDVNRHKYRDPAVLASVISDVRPDVLDLHEEPFSVSARQWLRAAPADLPIVMYTAQNIDKRFPPPFSGYERGALRRVTGMYPCSRQAAAVARAKGFAGIIQVIPLGFDAGVYRPGGQSLDDPELVLGLFGRLVREKGVLAAVHVLARLRRVRPARLILVGEGPDERAAVALAERLGIGQSVEVASGLSQQEVASKYRRVHVVLAPSVSTPTWAEQFGRVIVEAQASGAVVAGYASGAIPEIAGHAATLAPEGRLDVLAENVISLIGTPGDWMWRREAGLELARNRTWDCVATEHVDLYRRVLAAPSRVTPSRNPAKRRLAASEEFGPTAATPAGPRPFAFPPLRKGGAIPTLLGGAIDRAEKLVAGLLLKI